MSSTARSQPHNIESADRSAIRLGLAVLCLAFFASGAAGLMYQVLWVRLLGLVFGVTVYAASAVVATFMAGLALGSLAADRLAKRWPHPLRTFAAIESAIAIVALLSPALLHAVEAGYVRLAPAIGGSLPTVTALRVISSCIVLLIPTTLMGATLPLLVKAAGRLSSALERHPAILYASNTGGAIVGAIVCGFLTIGRLGIGRSFLIGAALNLTAAACAVLLSFRSGTPVGMGARPIAHEVAGISPSARRRVLIVFFISGLVSLGLEIAWFRVLTLFVEASTYAFTMMLAVVLAGIALGSASIAPFMTRGGRLQPSVLLRRFGILQGVTAITVLVSFAMLGVAYAPLYAYFARVGESSGVSSIPVAVLATIAILPPMLLFGAAFPVGLHLWMAGAPLDDQPRHIGRLYAVNVSGAIVGSLVTGFAMLPAAGTRWSLIALSGVALTGALVILTDRSGDRRWTRSAMALAMIAIWAGAALLVRDPFVVVLGVRYPGERLVWKSEGVQTTASVHTAQHGGYTLYLDGMHQANDSGGMVAYHRRLAHLPLALHPNPRRVLVIGLGGGATAGAAAVHEGVTLDIVELSSTVVAAARRFSHINYDVLRQPNVHLRVDDARNYLLLTRDRYDVITADIIQPHYAGAGNVYSLEYFQLARHALAEGGMMLQWIGKRPDPEYSLIMRTFLTAFPNATLWASGELMIGTVEPLRIDRRAFDRKVGSGMLRAWYASLGTGTFDDLLALYTAGPDEMRAFLGSGPVLTDDRPAMEFFRSLDRSGPQGDRSLLKGDVRRHLAGEAARVR